MEIKIQQLLVPNKLTSIILIKISKYMTVNVKKHYTHQCIKLLPKYCNIYFHDRRSEKLSQATIICNEYFELNYSTCENR